MILHPSGRRARETPWFASLAANGGSRTLHRYQSVALQRVPP